MDKIDALNDIYLVISLAEHVNEILFGECSGTSNRFSWCKGNIQTIKNARKAYEILAKD